MEKLESKTIVVKVKDLVPYARNPRRNDQAVEALKQSLKDFDYVSRIVVAEDMTIVAGHTRLKAMLELGWQDREIEVVQYHAPADKVRAYRIADNSTGDIAEWDYDLLDEELADLPEFDMSDYGLDVEEVFIEAESVDKVEDVPAPEPPEEPVTQRGWIYRLGDHVVMCGDSTSPEDVQRLMKAAGGGEIDMVMTDPPYNVSYEGKTADKLTISNDSMDSDQFIEFLSKAFGLMAGCLKAGGSVYIWHASWNSRELLDACQSAGISIKQTLIWVKNCFVLGHMDYQWQQEPCFYGWKDGAPHYFISDRGQSTVTEQEMEDIAGLSEKRVREILAEMLAKTPTDVIHEKKPVANADHPTMKPVPLIARFIHNSSCRGERIMDPFGGSGSTLMACEQLGRRCVTMEYDPRFVDVIVRRWEEYTGRKAVRVDG